MFLISELYQIAKPLRQQVYPSTEPARTLFREINARVN